MGNHNSHARVILSDGTIHACHKPLTVAELMLDHPHQVVVDPTNPKPLPADTILQTNKLYLMLPKSTSVSSHHARRLLHSTNAAYTGFLPFFAKMCPALHVIRSGKNKEKGGFFRHELGSDYYLTRQLSSWKPSLDTIKEKGVKAKIRHWLL